jgi:PHP domain-containing protein
MIGTNPYLERGYVALKFEPHLHTLHSDGQSTVAAMFTACKAAGYQAVALTDHNTLSGLAEARAVAADLDLVLLPGVEVTTFHGHAVVLGVSRVPEWRDLAARGLDALAAEVHAEGGVLSVAHAASLGSPVCSGCAWEWAVEPRSVDFWEIMNSARLSTDVPIELWRQRLGDGGRIAPVGAGDVHSEAAAATVRAATYAYVREQSPEALLDALHHRRVFASEGARLDFWLERADGAAALVGEEVSGDGWQPHSEPAAEFQNVEVGPGRCCVHATLRDSNGRLQAISAPIWISTSH